MHRLQQSLRQRGRPLQTHHHPHRWVPPGLPQSRPPHTPPPQIFIILISSPGEKPFLCDKCGRGFNRVDNLRSHVKTVHQGKAGIKILEPEEGDEVNIVTVASDDMVTLATEALAATAVTQLTGELGVPETSRKRGFIHGVQLGGPGPIPRGKFIHRVQLGGPGTVPKARFAHGVQLGGPRGRPKKGSLVTGCNLGIPEPSQKGG